MNSCFAYEQCAVPHFTLTHVLHSAILGMVIKRLTSKLFSVSDAPKSEIRWMMQALGVGLSQPVPSKAIGVLEEWVRLRVEERKPLQYILGDVPFWKGELKISTREPILIPRPETEEICHWVVSQLQGFSGRILDIGTGTGCIALALAKALPHSQVVGIDQSTIAVDLSRENSQTNQVSNVTFRNLEITSSTSPEDVLSGGDMFDFVISNPPYVTELEWESLQPEVKLWEDTRALVGGPDGMEVYRNIARLLPGILKLSSRHPVAVFEIGEAQGPQLSRIMGRYSCKIHTDMFGNSRWVSCA